MMGIKWAGMDKFIGIIGSTQGLYVSTDMADAMKAVAPKVEQVTAIPYGYPVMVVASLPPLSYLLIPARLEGETIKDWMKRWEGNIGEEVIK